MPCGDITEEIKVVVDKHDRLKSYSLRKKTCGGAVGLESLLLEKLSGSSVDELLWLNEFEFGQDHLPENHVEEFLNLKHLLAIKAVLEVYTGHASGSVGDSCSVASVRYDDDDDVVIEADIDVELITEQIKACAHCGPG